MSIHIYTYPLESMNTDDLRGIEALTNIILSCEENPLESLIKRLKRTGFIYNNIDMTNSSITRHELFRRSFEGKRNQKIEILDHHDHNYQEIKIKLVEDPKKIK